MLFGRHTHAGVNVVAGSLQLTYSDRSHVPGGWYATAKFVIEWVAAAVLIVLTAPLIAAMAIATKLTSPGPAFYSQTRLGKDGKQFTIWKIRSMKHNCESQSGAVWSRSLGDDHRITRIGRFLRETHLDELPQLWNVLTGDMSLIGPRPERPELAVRLERALPRYRERLAVRPGLTGLAQMQRPADAELEDVRHKLAYDLYYIRQLSFALDVRIVLCTVFHMAGLCLNSLGKVMVKSYGDDAERGIDSVPMNVVDGKQQIGVA